jgi:hypothetical protein
MSKSDYNSGYLWLTCTTLDQIEAIKKEVPEKAFIENFD